MRSITNQLKIETDLGQILAASVVQSHEIRPENILLRSLEFKPKLPLGMSVKRCTAVLLMIDQTAAIERVTLSLKLKTLIRGSTCTGQFLDAQEWSENGKLVVFGTEDGEALDLRITELDCYNEAVVQYESNSMILMLENLPKIHKPSFHFIVAENDDPEPVKASAWFAVDQSHNDLSSLVVKNSASRA